jgi:hypothetical protein
MKVTAIQKQTVDLTVDYEEFEVSFTWTRKRGITKSYWFTPSGKCKLWIGGLGNQRVGKVQPKVYKELVRQAKAGKTELFIWGSTYYCLSGGDGIDECSNLNNIMYSAREEWEQRKYVENWVEDNRVMI